MSAVFEGLLLRFDGVDEACFQIGSYLKSKKVPISLDYRNLDDDVFVIFRTDDRNAPFSEDVEKLAVELSAAVNKALVVRYDSRTGYRSSSYFEGGVPIIGFDNEDEIYLGVNEDGTLSGEQFTYDQVIGGVDYEMSQNAIQSGLEKLGAGNWDKLLEFIDNQS